MKQTTINLIAELRLIIGYLGEKSQFNWWGSNFLGASSDMFLMHPFPRTTLLAQYHGVSEAALLVHDRFIGLGKNYHLYRLPDSIEKSIADTIQEHAGSEELISSTRSQETAIQRLSELAPSLEAQEGPMPVGVFDDRNLDELIHAIAGFYQTAFSEGIKCYPFMKGEDEV